MLKAKRAVLMVVLGSVLLAGCATPTELELQTVERGREMGAALLESFAEAMRQKDPTLIVSLLPPGMPPQQTRLKQMGFVQTSWLQLYKGYDVDAEGALSAVHWRRWQEGCFWVSVPGSNSPGDRLLDQFELVRVAERWYIRDFRLATPMPGDALDLPQELMAQLQPEVRAIMEALRDGHPGEIDSMLPRGGHTRWPELTFWQKLTLPKPDRPLTIFDDLKLVQKLYIRRWPDLDEPVQAAYLSPGRIVAFYDIPYDWPQGGISQTDLMRVEMTFELQRGEWSLFRIRLFGKAFPYS